MKKLALALVLAGAMLTVGMPFAKGISEVTRFSVSEAYAATLSPPPFIRGRLVCALNVNRFLKKLGRRHTGSASSHSFFRFPRTSAPRAGDVVFNRRGRAGGHVQVYDGRGMCWNPSQRRQRWELRACGSTWRRHAKTYLRTR